MTDLAELERRITSALDRVRSGLAAIEAPVAEPGADPAEITALQTRIAVLEGQLEDERNANAQLEDRVRALKDRQDTTVAELSAQSGALAQEKADLVDQSSRLRQVNAELRDMNARLRAVVADKASDPHLVNKAMLAELEALRATRTADMAEVDAILTELRPLVQQEEQ